MNDTAASGPLGNVPRAFLNLLNAQMKLGMDLLESVTGVSASRLAGSLQRSGRRLHAGCCDIPPPCWVPRPLGECVSHVCPCATACVRLVVTNCDATSRRVVRVEASGPHVKVDPPQLVLTPLERGTVQVCVAVPAEARQGDKIETLVRVRGCREHYLRWTVSVGTLGMDSCHEIEIDDCPDLVHHWYDHFYCHRSCSHPQPHPGTVTHG